MKNRNLNGFDGIVSHALFALAVLLMIVPAGFGYHLFYYKAGAIYVPGKWTSVANFTVGSSTGATDITAEVTAAAGRWKAITTAKSPLGTFTAVPAGTKYNGTNFGTAWGKLTGDGKQEVVYDEDGTAFAKFSLDPATINGLGTTHVEIVGGAAVIDDAVLLINGTRNNFDRPSTETHELGHVQGLAHSAVGMYNSASISGESGQTFGPGGDVLDPIDVMSVPTMHPFSTNTGSSRRNPKADDIAALGELYPAATFSTTLGSISGTVTRCTDGTPVTGVNVRVVNTGNTNLQLGRFTGFDGNTTGSYTVNGIPPGSYRVIIEGLGANGFTINRFTRTVPVKAENDFPSTYYKTNCGADYVGSPAGTPAPDGNATPVMASAGGATPNTNFKVGAVDLAFVVDNTGSMGQEIGAVRTALAQFISDTQAATTAAGKPFPTVAVVPFVDTPSVQVISNKPATLQSVISEQYAYGGGDCPEPSNNAILTAGRLLKNKGVAILFTDADSDYNGPSRATVDSYFASKELRLSVLLSGSCSGISAPSPGGAAASPAPLGRGSSENDEYQPDPPLGVLPSTTVFSDEALSSGGIFAVNTEIKSGITTGYVNTAANIADSSVVPAIGLVSPGRGPAGATMNVAITGSNTNFTGASTVTFSGGGITVNSINTLSATSILANITIASSAAQTFRDVSVSSVLGGSATEVAKGTGSFEVVADPGAPTILGVQPTIAGQGQTVDLLVSATDAHFAAGTSMLYFGNGVTVNTLAVTGPNSARANVTIDATAQVGFRHVSAQTGTETAYDTGNGAFFVSALGQLIPVIVGITPNSGDQGQTGISLTIQGANTHFEEGSSVLTFSNPGISVANLTITSPTSATAVINIAPDAALGFSDVLITTGGEGAALLSGFQVLPAPPVAATPVISLPGGSYSAAQSVTLTDSTPGATIYYTTDGSTPSAGSTKYTAAIIVSASETLKAVAAAPGYISSAVAAATYLIGGGTAQCTYIDYSKGFTGKGMTLNGSAKSSGGLLQLTDGQSFESGSAFFSTRVPNAAFTTDVTFQLLNPDADGIAFVLQDNAATALGGNGSGLGYFGIPNSVALKFDLHNNSGEGASSTGLYFNGALPTTPSVDLLSKGIDLHSGHIFAVHLTYDGAIVSVTISDTTTKASYTITQPIEHLSAGPTSYAGFTGATGRLNATQNILSWTYSAKGACPVE